MVTYSIHLYSRSSLYFILCFLYTLACNKNKLPPGFQKLQENTKHGLHFRSYYQFKNLTIAAESYQEGAEPNQTKLICPRKRHKVYKNKPNSPKRLTRGQFKNMSGKPHVFIIQLISHNINLQTKLYPQQIYKQQNRSKDCEIRHM